MKKNLTALTLLVFAGLLLGQQLNEVHFRSLVRTVTPSPAQRTALSNLWTSIDLQKTNTTLEFFRVEKSGTNFIVTVVESVRVKLVEN